MKIAIGADHAGFKYKEQIKQFLKEKGHEVHDFGTYSEDAVDYPIFIRPVVEEVVRGESGRGIVLGGSGNGEAIAANRLKGIRCTLCWNIETASLARRHNNANVLALGARMISLEEALEIVNTWIETPFEGGRHLRRIKQIDQKEIAEKDVSKGRGMPIAETKADESAERSAKSKKEKFDVFITFRYLRYSEGKNSIEFETLPGLKEPTVVNIPSPERWQSEIPEWARDRREEILGRIKPKCEHLKCEWKEF